MSGGIEQIIQTIHQILSDPAVSGLGTVIGIGSAAASGMKFLVSEFSKKKEPVETRVLQKTNHPQHKDSLLTTSTDVSGIIVTRPSSQKTNRSPRVPSSFKK